MNGIVRNLICGWAHKVYVVPRLEGGEGYDIVIRIDGTYFNGVQDELVDYWNEELAEFLRQQRQGSC